MKTKPKTNFTLRTPYPHQVSALRFMEGKDRGALFMDAGLGKTLVSLRGLGLSESKRRSLIICPASLRFNWEDECKKERVAKAEINSYEWLVKTVEEIVLGIRSDEIKKKKLKKFFGKYEALIVDESLYIKNLAAKRTKSVINISNFIRSIWFLTGTPTSTSSTDLFPTLSICAPGKWGKFKDFKKRYAHSIWDKYQKKDKADGYKNVIELREKMKPYCLRISRKAIAHLLPERMESVFRIHDKNTEIFLESPESLLKKINSPHIAHVRQTAALLKMNSYLDSLRDRGIESGIIFAWHTEISNLLVSRLDKLGGARLVTGKISDKDKYEHIRQFQEKEIDWLVINLRAGGVGLNLQRAGYVGFFELPWTWDGVEQALSRAIRLGNENQGVLVEYILLSESIDEAIYKIVCKRRRKSKELT